MKPSPISPEKIKHFVALFQSDNDGSFSANDDVGSGNSMDQLSPWHFWALVCFARHRSRQIWVADIVKYRLRGELEVLAKTGALGHPDVPQSGIVPADPEWEYYFHGRGCCLTHRGTGESIDVDFYEDSGDYFSFWFYKQYLKSLKSPGFPEKRLIELHPSIDSLAIVVEDLFESDTFVKHPESNVYKLSEQVISLIPNIERFSKIIAESQTPQLAIRSGDWFLASDVTRSDTDHGERESRIGERVQSLIRDRLAVAQRIFERAERRSIALAAICEVSPGHAQSYIIRILKEPANGAVSDALELIHQSNDPDWCSHVFGMLQSSEQSPCHLGASDWHAAASFLLEHDFQREFVIDSFDDHSTADFALLSLEHAPRKSKSIFHKALRSTVPRERIRAAAMLVILDQPWSYDQLIAVLSDFDDQEMTLYPRAALLASKHTEHHSIVEAWEAAHPRKPENGKYMSFGEWAIREKDSYLAYEIQNLHDTVWPLRGTKVRRET
jgi:hypothetical protein